MSRKPDSSAPCLPLYAETHGTDTQPLLLLHGFGTNRHTWRAWIPELVSRHRLLVMDLKGFGAAPKPRDNLYSPQDQASLLTRWILEQDLQGLTLVGHSLGGGVALLVARELRDQAPGRIRRLVLLASIAYPQTISPYLRLLGIPILGPLALTVVPTRYVIRIAMRKAYHPSHPVPEALVEAYSNPLRSGAGRLALSRSARGLLAGTVPSRSGMYRELDLPTLLLWGRADPVVPLWVGQRLEKELPLARLEVLDRCGHMPQEEAPEESLRLLRNFLDATP